MPVRTLLGACVTIPQLPLLLQRPHWQSPVHLSTTCLAALLLLVFILQSHLSPVASSSYTYTCLTAHLPTLLCALLLPLPPGLKLTIPPPAASCRQKPNYPTHAQLLSCHDAHLHTFSSVCLLKQQYQQLITIPNFYSQSFSLETFLDYSEAHSE